MRLLPILALSLFCSCSLLGGADGEGLALTLDTFRGQLDAVKDTADGVAAGTATNAELAASIVGAIDHAAESSADLAAGFHEAVDSLKGDFNETKEAAGSTVSSVVNLIKDDPMGVGLSLLVAIGVLFQGKKMAKAEVNSERDSSRLAQGLKPAGNVVGYEPPKA